MELWCLEDKLRMGPIHQWSQEGKRMIIEYLDKMIKKGTIQSSSSLVGSPILVVPKTNGKGLRLWIEYRHLNEHTKRETTPPPILDELSRRIHNATHITKIDMKAGFHSIPMAVGCKKFTPFRTRVALSEYMLMQFWLTNAPATFQREINQIRWTSFRIEIVLDTKVEMDDNDGMVQVAYIDDRLIPTMIWLQKHHRQVSKAVQLLMNNNMCVEIGKCILDSTEVPVLGSIVTGEGPRMDPEKVEAIVDWPWHTTLKEVQEQFRLWNFYRRFIPSYAAILSSITNLFRKDKK